MQQFCDPFDPFAEPVEFVDPIHDIWSEHTSIIMVSTRKNLSQSFGNVPPVIQVLQIRD